jgi:amino acid adenylation domain-containing protein
VSIDEPLTPAPPVDALFDALVRRDVRLWLEGERLRVSAPKGALDDALRALISSRKDELIAVLKSGKGTGARDSIPRLPRGGPLPMSSVQQRLWFLDRLDPGSPAYNIGIGVRFKGPLNASLLHQTLDLLVVRHESLRMRIADSEGTPVVELLAAQTADFELIDLAHLAGAAREAEMRREHANCLRAAFDLAKGPLGRFRLIRLQPDDHVLCISMHHAASDGWSIGIAVSDICRMYEALAAGRAPQLQPLLVQYADFAGWEREQLQTGRMAGHLAFWKQQLAGAPAVLELPRDRARPAVQSLRGNRLKRQFAAQLLQSLKELSRREDVTLFMTLLAAWQVLLHRYSGQEDIVVGSPVANRDQAVLQNVIGCLVNNVALRANFAGNPRFTEFLARLKRTTLDAFEHAELPFDVVVDGLSPQRSASHAPLFQVLFTLMSYSTMSHTTGVAGPAGLSAEPLESDTEASRFDLTIEMAEMGGELHAGYEYATDLFDETTIARLHAHFESLLAEVVSDPARRVLDLPLLSPAEQRLLLDDWNETALEHDRGRCLHQLFEGTARRTPDAVAVADAFETITFAHLDRRANQLAHLLLACGVAPGARVGICLDRTIDMPLALIAVLKCGAAYVPLDPAHPSERISYTLADAEVACVVTLAQFKSQLGNSKAPLLLLDELQAQLAAQPGVAPNLPCQPDDLAYVIYTSGSTGRPKGVEVEHRNVVSFLEAMRREPGLCEKDVLLAVTTLSFDIAGLEMWLPMMVGARIVLASRADVLDGHSLSALVQRHAVTLLQATPATWRLLIESGWTGSPALKALCGGEALPADLAVSLLARVAELWNVYGPTETTIWSTLYRVQTPQNPLPIGRPIANTRVYVLEPSGAPAPISVAGELCIAGEGVARGYRNLPALTAEKFANITLANGRTERVYRTGDMARWRPDGQLEFLGRNDTQVKVRGYRIELGEIEAVLSTHPGISQCVVSVREDAPGDQRLVGYVVTAAGTRFDVDSARSTLRNRLPEYMVPNLFMPLDSLPLTPNGKIDRKMLPKPQEPSPSSETAGQKSAAVPMTIPQQGVAAIWRELLQLKHVGLNDNFFDLGGHSLLLVRLQSALKRDFGLDLPLVELLQRTTVSAQAERLSAPRAHLPREAWNVVELQPLGTKTPIITINNAVMYYPLARKIGTDRRFVTVQLFDPADPQPVSNYSLEEIIAQYVRLIRDAQPQGPYVLMGLCVAGIIAYEAAAELRRAGEQVPLVIMAETWRTGYEVRLSRLKTLWVTLGLKFRYRMHTLRLLRSKRIKLEEFLATTRIAKWKPVMRALSALGLIEDAARPQELSWEDRLFQSALIEARDRHQLSISSGDVVLLQSEAWGGALVDPKMGWSTHVTGEILNFVVPGWHEYMFHDERACALIAGHLKPLIERIDAANGS